MARVVFQIDQVKIENQKADSDHSDSDWLTLTWTVANFVTKSERTESRTHHLSGTIHTGDVIDGPFATDPIDLSANDILVVGYVIVNLGSTDDEVDQAKAAAQVADEVVSKIGPVAGAVLGTIFGGDPASGYKLGEEIAGALSTVIDIAGGILDELGIGRENCNGVVLHGSLTYLPAEIPGALGESASKRHAGPQDNDDCGAAPHTELSFSLQPGGTVLDPIPGKPVTSGAWQTIRGGHELVSLSDHLVLDYEPATGAFRVWNRAKTPVKGEDPLPGSPVCEGMLDLFKGANVCPLGGNVVLAWHPDGTHAVSEYLLPRREDDGGVLVDDRVLTNAFTDASFNGRWQTIDADHRLVALGDTVLDWVPTTSEYRLWSRADVEPWGDCPDEDDPLPGDARTKGRWKTIGADHQLIAMRSGAQQLVLDWVAGDGSYRVWQFDPNAASGDDPLPGEAIAEGYWRTIKGDRRLVDLGSGLLLDWTPADGRYRLWRIREAW